MFPDHNNGAAFVPEFETSLTEFDEGPGFLLVGLKMADKSFGKNKTSLFSVYLERYWRHSSVVLPGQGTPQSPYV
jgi:hypothetical protein